MHAAFNNSSEETKEEVRHTFRNDDGEKVLYEIMNSTIRYMHDAGVEDSEFLGNRAKDNWKRRERTAFGQGDIWFGTLLVAVEDGRVELGICDWEFAGFNHPAADIAQLGQEACDQY
jgi:thiamine kinase-like enzyme